MKLFLEMLCLGQTDIWFHPLYNFDIFSYQAILAISNTMKKKVGTCPYVLICSGASIVVLVLIANFECLKEPMGLVLSLLEPLDIVRYTHVRSQ